MEHQLNKISSSSGSESEAHIIRTNVNSFFCQINHISQEVGYGLISSTIIPAGKLILVVDTSIAVPIGTKSMHICYNCFRVSSKVKRREDCPHLFFCSVECLASSADYLDFFASVLCIASEHGSKTDSQSINVTVGQNISIKNQQQELFSTIMLVTKILYEANVQYLYNRCMPNSLTEIFQLNLHSSETLSVDTLSLIDTLSTQLILTFDATVSDSDKQSLLQQYYPSFELTRALLENLFRAVQYNSYTFSVPNLSQTHMLCLTPLLARINHSCQPNCIMQVRLPMSALDLVTGPVKGSNKKSNIPKLQLLLHCVKDTVGGSELTTSYLNMPCLPLSARSELLSAGFHFTCTCPRCLEERRQEGIVLNGNCQSVVSEEQWLKDLHESITSSSVSTKVSVSNLSRIWNNIIKPLSNTKPPSAGNIDTISIQYSVVYMCHDVAMYALSSTNKPSDEVGTDSALSIVLACSIASQCYVLVGHKFSSSRLQLLLTAFVQLPSLQRTYRSYSVQWKIVECMVTICDSITEMLSVLDSDPRFVVYEKIRFAVGKVKSTLS